MPCAAEDPKDTDQLLTRQYKPRLLFEAAATKSAGGDPFTAAKTPEQRRFLTEYYRVLREDSDAVRKDRTYLFMEPLRRCGVSFPKGAIVLWTPLDPALHVTHTPAGMKQIEKCMGLILRR